MKLKDMIAVMQAAEKGALIEVRGLSCGTWSIMKIAPVWNWHEYDYRIRPEKVKLWANVRKNGKVTAYTAECTAKAAYCEDIVCHGNVIVRVAVPMEEISCANQ